MEDDRTALLETQLAQAKQIAEEADRKYEEVSTNVVSLPGSSRLEIMANAQGKL